MRRAQIGCGVLSALCVLLLLTVAGSAQSRKRGGEDARSLQAPPGLTSGGVAAEPRIALVIGNAAYTYGPLRNPVNDAMAMAATLGQLGFEVKLLKNAKRDEILEAIARLGQQLSRGGVGLFFFAGHGIQVKGENYLVPLDAPIDSDILEDKMVPVQRVLDRMEDAKNELNILILDACRNNPFASKTRGAQQGLAHMEGPNGSVVAFAASRNQTASDGEGANGLYTSHLLRNMQIPGLPLEQMFKYVRNGVSDATGGKQVPEEWTKLRRDFSFLPTGQSPPALPPAPTPTAAPIPPVIPPTQVAKTPVRPETQVASLPPASPTGGARQATRVYIEYDNDSRYLVPHLEGQIRERQLTLVRQYDRSPQTLKILLRSTVATESASINAKKARMSVQFSVQNSVGQEVFQDTSLVHGSAADYDQALQDASQVWGSMARQKGLLEKVFRVQ